MTPNANQLDVTAVLLEETGAAMSLEIEDYAHCRLCIEEMPVGESPSIWARLNVGLTRYGLQIWCVRHDMNVVALKLGVKDGDNITINNPEQIEGVCDFCLERPANWVYPADDFQYDDINVGQLTMSQQGSVGNWAACETCHELIADHNLPALGERSLQFYLAKNIPVLGEPPDDVVDGLRDAIRQLHVLFFENRRGPGYLEDQE